jgi:DNA primase
VFEAFKRRAPRTPAKAGQASRGPWRGKKGERGAFKPEPEPVSAALKNSLLARAGGALKVKEMEVCHLILDEPELAERYAELLAALVFSDPLLDRLRQELLNVAASGSRLEKSGLENHLIRHGMADIVERLKAHNVLASEGGEDTDVRFLRAASQLRDMAEIDPERRRALERFKREPNEESWLEVRRLLEGRSGE